MRFIVESSLVKFKIWVKVKFKCMNDDHVYDEDKMSQAHVQVLHNQGQVQSKQGHAYDDSQVKYYVSSIIKEV